MRGRIVSFLLRHTLESIWALHCVLGSALRTHSYITPNSLQKIITNLVTETSAHLSP